MSNRLAHVERVLTDAYSQSASSALAASWRRSLVMYHLDPSRRRPSERLPEAQLKSCLEHSEALIRVSKERLDSLYTTVGSSGCGVFLTDAQGVIVDKRCSSSDAGFFKKCDLRRGANWSEAAEGTNGIGTCLAEQRPVIIDRDQHFFACHISMSCIDAPIFGSNGQLIGALDVSTARLDHDSRMNALICASVHQIAQQIETDMFQIAFSNKRLVMASPNNADGCALFAVDEDDLVVGATRAARRSVGLPKTGSFDPIPHADLINIVQPECSLRGFDRGEKAAIKRALSRSNGNVSQAAANLGVGRATLYRRMKKLNLN